ncbi:hypothetical protein RHMOL_Rhmol09G0000300 [Rhododendron molle]|uniref:Uncharacterized protein n=1 Tax=Rhododendron molle TaxID=49168 RepID=A0ACC0M7U4_RHOML|nr:hypothetical protein RHMOL_Rhmol09G0000300 [Rhododendron molle]
MLRMSERPRKDHVLEGIFFDKDSIMSQPLVVYEQCLPNDNADNTYDGGKWCKTTDMVDRSKSTIYDEDPEHEGIALGELTAMLPVHNTQQSSI